MRGLLYVVAIIVGAACIAHGQSTPEKKYTPELFTSYIGITTPIVKANIPAGTCRTLIGQADKIVSTPEGLKSIAEHDLQVASLNLRNCATSDLARLDRDLAVGLYGEVVSELERRERAGK